MPITDKEREILRPFQRFDSAIYDHFAARFQERIEHFGADRMSRSVKELRRLNEQVSRACGIRRESSKSRRVPPVNRIMGNAIALRVTR